MLNRDDIPKFESKHYAKLALNELIVFAVYYLDQIGMSISNENITASAFLLFPEVFCLHGYPEWPDSSRVNKRWLDCRGRGYITGNTANDFKLTPKGYELALKTSERLSGKRPIFKSGSIDNNRVSTHTRAGKFVKMIEQSDAYQIFKRSGTVEGINEYDFRSMLMCTMETSGKVLRGNINEFKEHVKSYEREDIKTMLELLEEKFIRLLVRDASQKKYEGGMFKKKIH